jgi:hypothetical protein
MVNASDCNRIVTEENCESPCEWDKEIVDGLRCHFAKQRSWWMRGAKGASPCLRWLDPAVPNKKAKVLVMPTSKQIEKETQQDGPPSAGAPRGDGVEAGAEVQAEAKAKAEFEANAKGRSYFCTSHFPDVELGSRYRIGGRIFVSVPSPFKLMFDYFLNLYERRSKSAGHLAELVIHAGNIFVANESSIRKGVETADLATVRKTVNILAALLEQKSITSAEIINGTRSALKRQPVNCLILKQSHPTAEEASKEKAAGEDTDIEEKAAGRMVLGRSDTEALLQFLENESLSATKRGGQALTECHLPVWKLVGTLSANDATGQIELNVTGNQQRTKENAERKLKIELMVHTNATAGVLTFTNVQETQNHTTRQTKIEVTTSQKTLFRENVIRQVARLSRTSRKDIIGAIVKEINDTLFTETAIDNMDNANILEMAVSNAASNNHHIPKRQSQHVMYEVKRQDSNVRSLYNSTDSSAAYQAVASLTSRSKAEVDHAYNTFAAFILHSYKGSGAEKSLLRRAFKLTS